MVSVALHFGIWQTPKSWGCLWFGSCSANLSSALRWMSQHCAPHGVGQVQQERDATESSWAGSWLETMVDVEQDLTCMILYEIADHYLILQREITCFARDAPKTQSCAPSQSPGCWFESRARAATWSRHRWILGFGRTFWKPAALPMPLDTCPRNDVFFGEAVKGLVVFSPELEAVADGCPLS